MTIKVGSKSEEIIIKKYEGIAAMKVVAVNPTSVELAKLFNRAESENPPIYTGLNDKQEKQVYIKFWCKTDVSSQTNNGIELITPVSFSLTEVFNTSNDGTKVQVIDKYGRTAWVTKEQFQNKEVPVYSNGPANIDKDYVACYKGQEQLTQFIIKWGNVPSVQKYDSNTKVWSLVENPEDSEATLDMKKLFTEDFSELKDLQKLLAEYSFKAAIGVRTADNGNLYQSCYNNFFLKNSATNYKKLTDEIAASQNGGGYPNTVFSTEPLHEYVAATSFDTPAQGTENKWANFNK